MLQLFGLIAGLLSILSYIPYIRDIFRLTTKPERASWFIWTILGSIAFFSQLAKGASDSLWLVGVQTVGVAVIFTLSIRYGVGGFARRDILALITAGIGLMLWYVTHEAATALILVVVIDAVGALLSVIKSYENPESETLAAWILSGIGGLFAALAVGSFSYILLLYPVYIFFANFAVALAILFGRRNIHHA